MRTISKLILYILFLFIIGCGGTASITRVGNQNYQPLPDSVEVKVFSKDTEIKLPFTTLGIISYTNPGKYQVLTLEDAIPALKSKARSIGANAIIIDETASTKSGIISTGISVRARAVIIENGN